MIRFIHCFVNRFTLSVAAVLACAPAFAAEDEIRGLDCYVESRCIEHVSPCSLSGYKPVNTPGQCGRREGTTYPYRLKSSFRFASRVILNHVCVREIGDPVRFQEQLTETHTVFGGLTTECYWTNSADQFPDALATEAKDRGAAACEVERDFFAETLPECE